MAGESDRASGSDGNEALIHAAQAHLSDLHRLRDAPCGTAVKVPDMTIGKFGRVADKIGQSCQFGLERIIDGDTVVATLVTESQVSTRLPCPSGGEICMVTTTRAVLYSVRCRLAGIQAPEADTPEGEQSVQVLAGLFEKYKPGLCMLLPKREKYGRFVIDIPTVTDQMVRLGAAVEVKWEEQIYT